MASSSTQDPWHESEEDPWQESDEDREEYLKKWLQSQTVDVNSQRVFLSLPIEAQDAVLAMGPVHGTWAKNPYGLLMDRIRSEYSGWVTLDPTRAAERGKEIEIEQSKKQVKDTICLCIRSESHRIGSRGEHGNS